MEKKIILVVLLCCLMAFLCGCGHKIGDEIANNFIFIKSVGYLNLVYDEDTKIMYYLNGKSGHYNFAICPYYISNGEIGIYGVNYVQ